MVHKFWSFYANILRRVTEIGCLKRAKKTFLWFLIYDFRRLCDDEINQVRMEDNSHDLQLLVRHLNHDSAAVCSKSQSSLQKNVLCVEIHSKKILSGSNF